MRISDAVYTYDVTSTAYDEPFSVHVVEADDATLLFGAGTDDTVDDVLRFVETHGVDTVVVEHGHRDHYLGVPALRERTAIDVAIPERDAHMLDDVDVRPEYHLEHGDVLDGVRTVATPGHTPGNTSFVYDGTLIAGDTVVGSDSIYAANGYWGGALDVLASDYNHDDAQARRAVTRLLDDDVERVLVTHGSNVLDDGSRALDDLAFALDRRE
ncbi:MAG: MBL fold metallo-hydrolase [Haloarculaceae archaeon]